jgi:mRNA interferase HigB
MRVVKPSTIKAYGRQHPDADSSLRGWLKATIDAEWMSLQHARDMFPNADGVKVKSGRTVTVFNICGNKYRLVVAIHYNSGKVYVLRFMTHAEYDKEKWKEQL